MVILRSFNFACKLNVFINILKNNAKKTQMEDFVVPGLLLARAVAFWVFIVVKD